MPLTPDMLQSLFNKTIPAVDAKDFLLQTTQEHPYFTAAHFFLLQQTASDHFDYEKQVAKTTILFNNPFWLNFKLQDFNNNAANTIEPVINIEENVNNVIEETSAVTIEERQEQTADNIIDGIPTEEPVIVAEENNNEVIEEVPAPIIEEQTVDNIIDAIPTEESAIEEEPITKEEDTVTEEEIAPIKIDLKLSDTKDEEITFEPLHTTDYFASQGIKLSEEVKTGDKLGKQLKSFTEWLKTMKKVHVENVLESSPESDTAIQTLAEKSNTEDAVLTESMAEVLIQQGKTGKALEVYQKLSLLNPSKSAYFAAKIEQLKR